MVVTRRCFYFGGIKMAKETVKVDNGLEEIKLTKNEEIGKKKDKIKKEKPKKEKAKKEPGKKGYFSKLMTEIKLVSWPTKKSVFKYSLATVLMIVLMAAFFIGVSAVFDLLYALVQGWIG